VLKTTLVLPLRHSGEITNMGWDIATPWAVDATGQCWIGGGHGEALTPCIPDHIVSSMETEGDEESAHDMRALLGLKPKRRVWMTSALAAGWTPPAGWKDPENE
jgi:hypothetical protein